MGEVENMSTLLTKLRLWKRRFFHQNKIKAKSSSSTFYSGPDYGTEAQEDLLIDDPSCDPPIIDKQDASSEEEYASLCDDVNADTLPVTGADDKLDPVELSSLNQTTNSICCPGEDEVIRTSHENVANNDSLSSNTLYYDCKEFDASPLDGGLSGKSRDAAPLIHPEIVCLQMGDLECVRRLTTCSTPNRKMTASSLYGEMIAVDPLRNEKERDVIAKTDLTPDMHSESSFLTDESKIISDVLFQIALSREDNTDDGSTSKKHPNKFVFKLKKLLSEISPRKENRDATYMSYSNCSTMTCLSSEKSSVDSSDEKGSSDSYKSSCTTCASVSEDDTDTSLKFTSSPSSSSTEAASKTSPDTSYDSRSSIVVTKKLPRESCPVMGTMASKMLILSEPVISKSETKSEEKLKSCSLPCKLAENDVENFDDSKNHCFHSSLESLSERSIRLRSYFTPSLRGLHSQSSLTHSDKSTEMVAMHSCSDSSSGKDSTASKASESDREKTSDGTSHSIFKFSPVPCKTIELERSFKMDSIRDYVNHSAFSNSLHFKKYWKEFLSEQTDDLYTFEDSVLCFKDYDDSRDALVYFDGKVYPLSDDSEDQAKHPEEGGDVSSSDQWSDTSLKKYNRMVDLKFNMLDALQGQTLIGPKLNDGIDVKKPNAEGEGEDHLCEFKPWASEVSSESGGCIECQSRDDAKDAVSKKPAGVAKVLGEDSVAVTVNDGEESGSILDEESTAESDDKNRGTLWVTCLAKVDEISEDLSQQITSNENDFSCPEHKKLESDSIPPQNTTEEQKMISITSLTGEDDALVANKDDDKVTRAEEIMVDDIPSHIAKMIIEIIEEEYAIEDDRAKGEVIDADDFGDDRIKITSDVYANSKKGEREIGDIDVCTFAKLVDEPEALAEAIVSSIFNSNHNDDKAGHHDECFSLTSVKDSFETTDMCTSQNAEDYVVVVSEVTDGESKECNECEDQIKLIQDDDNLVCSDDKDLDSLVISDSEIVSEQEDMGYANFLEEAMDFCTSIECFDNCSPLIPITLMTVSPTNSVSDGSVTWGVPVSESRDCSLFGSVTGLDDPVIVCSSEAILMKLRSELKESGKLVKNQCLTDNREVIEKVMEEIISDVENDSYSWYNRNESGQFIAQLQAGDESVAKSVDCCSDINPSSDHEINRKLDEVSIEEKVMLDDDVKDDEDDRYSVTSVIQDQEQSGGDVGSCQDVVKMDEANDEIFKGLQSKLIDYVAETEFCAQEKMNAAVGNVCGTEYLNQMYRNTEIETYIVFQRESGEEELVGRSFESDVILNDGKNNSKEFDLGENFILQSEKIAENEESKSGTSLGTDEIETDEKVEIANEYEDDIPVKAIHRSATDDNILTLSIYDYEHRRAIHNKRCFSSKNVDMKFDKMFKSFARLGHPNRTGFMMNFQNSTKWFKQAKIVDEDFTEDDANEAFKKKARTKSVLSLHEYREFIEELAKNRKMCLSELWEKMCNCGSPSLHELPRVRNDLTGDILTEAEPKGK